MKRLNISYTVDEQELETEILKLLESSQAYIEDYGQMVRLATSLVEADNYEGCIKTVSQMRDALASTDYRLHDLMNLILYTMQQQDQTPQQGDLEDPSLPSTPNASAEAKELNQIQDRMEDIKNNIKDLGLQIPDEQLQKIMRGQNDKAS
tara:strand:- start:103 stop:552 length:450 start_codon:yes stop_codon:yes gene_type:complete